MASKCPASKITEEMRSYVLKEHNKLRSQLANGEAKAKSNGLMPRSSNMHELEWDCGLEERAQQWAEYCDFEHSTQEFRNYSGENLYARWGYEEPKLDKKQFEDAIEGWWWEEIKDMPAHSTMDGTPGSVLHFTQMAWAITSKLGCGMAKCHNNNGYPFMVHVVCHYGPRGNWDKTIYEEGEPCSKCPDYGRVCNGNGLCAAGDKPAEATHDDETPSEEPEEELISHEETEMPSEEHTEDETIMPEEIEKPDSSCSASKITSAGRENILKKLNDIRTKVAMGQFSTSDGTYPAAKEMYKLRWNCTLEKLAQKHVEKCKYDHSEYFHKHFYGDGVGESLFSKWTFDNNPTGVLRRIRKRLIRISLEPFISKMGNWVDSLAFC
ncbi:unnamed protein product [Dracunculus medinensis]|uniref:SCP domain-containing protein n=1 Tax=Dracunculus medinensis TaxID=318479 RepID=A0A0N4URC2_DRAME|nr:unnamed protein product [Dracunculus medinensis]